MGHGVCPATLPSTRALKMSKISLCFLVPVYDHANTVADVCEHLRQYDRPILLVDDGSHRECSEELNRLGAQNRTHLVRLVRNSGKGTALRVGMAEAQRLGYTHVLTVDPDGQQEIDDLDGVLAMSVQHPGAMVVGSSQLEGRIPAIRQGAIALINVGTRLCCLSSAGHLSVCAVRVYPLQQINHLLSRYRCGNRVEFDIELLVRWIWRGGECLEVPVRTYYPRGNISHYRVMRDTLRMGKTLLRLTIGMLLHAPWLLQRARRMRRLARLEHKKMAQSQAGQPSGRRED